MRDFKELGVKPTVQKSFVGDKMKINKIMNREIVVHAYRIEDSKYGEGGEKRLQLSFSLGDVRHITFTASIVLMDMIRQVKPEDFPFTTTIIETDNGSFEFS
jgi:hypothetical protein